MKIEIFKPPTPGVLSILIRQWREIRLGFAKGGKEMKKIFCAVVVVMCLSMIPGLVWAQKAQSSFKFNLLTDITGQLRGWGVPQRIAFNMAIADINAAGGINKYPVEGFVHDTSTNPKEAVRLTRKLIDEGAPFIFGPFGSGDAKATHPIGKDFHVPMINFSCNLKGLTEDNYPTSFRVSFTSRVETLKPAFDFFTQQKPNMKKVAMVIDVSFPATIESRDIVFLPLLKQAGIDVAGEVECSAATQDFSAHVTKIKGMKVDGVVACIYPNEFVLFAKEMKRQGVTLPVLISAHAATPPTALAAGTDAEGWIAPGWSWYKHTEDPQIAKFMQRFTPEVKRQVSGHPGDPSFAEATTYDGTMITANILTQMKATPNMPIKTLRQGVIDGWKSVKGYKGLMGIITMPPSQDYNVMTEAVVFHNGVLTPVKK